MEMLVQLLLLSGLCSVTLSIQRGYILIQEKKTWDEAQAYCRQNHIDLATVLNDEDRLDLQTAEPTMTSEAWIGLYQEIYKWQWSYNSKNVSFLNWKTGEPNNNGGNDNCAVMNLGVWLDQPCDVYQTTLCYNVSESGAERFVFYGGSWLTRDQAQSYCRQQYTDLAIIESQAENDQLKIMVPYEWSAWIGLYKDRPLWKWSDASVSTFNINWMMGQPDSYGTSRLCGAAGPDGLIDDQPCSNALPFICVDTSTKQILRVEVKNVLNPNDPEMLENILKGIKQKMKDLGVEENIQLRWRIQPDGNVFLPKYE